MSYESAREYIHRYKSQADDLPARDQAMLDALNELTVALETDLTQIKAALSHVATLLETREKI